jgi:beta-fructofuranosidase
MRDPFVFTWSGRRWALLGAGLDDGPAVLLWSCDDLEAWRFERVWFTIKHPVVRTLAAADTWECPQLVEVDGSWVLLVSLWKAGILDRVVYAVGSLVEERGLPRFAPRTAGLVDEGTVLYAPQVLQDAPGGAPLMFGWIREAEVLGQALSLIEPDGLTMQPGDSVVGCLSLPRRLALKDDHLISAVDPAVFALLGDEVDPGVQGLLPPQSMLRVASTPVTLAGADIKVELPAHTDVWVDGEVLEAYPAGGVPGTFRDPGTLSWHLVNNWSDVQVRHVTTPARQRPTLTF